MSDLDEATQPICLNCRHWSILTQRDGCVRAPCHKRPIRMAACGCVSGYEWTEASHFCLKHEWLWPENFCRTVVFTSCVGRGKDRCTL